MLDGSRIINSVHDLKVRIKFFTEKTIDPNGVSAIFASVYGTEKFSAESLEWKYGANLSDDFSCLSAVDDGGKIGHAAIFYYDGKVGGEIIRFAQLGDLAVHTEKREPSATRGILAGRYCRLHRRGSLSITHGAIARSPKITPIAIKIYMKSKKCIIARIAKPAALMPI